MLGVPGTGPYGRLRSLTDLIRTEEMGLNQPMGPKRKKALMESIQRNKDARVELRREIAASKVKGSKHKK